MKRLFASVSLLLFSVTAYGHIRLEEPQSRYPIEVSGANKACPCGVGLSNRLCDISSDRSDPDRDESRATTLVAGTTITMRFRETVGHAGRYRIAFDDNGADLEDFNAHILVDVVDPGGNDGNTGDGNVWEIEVTLPDTPCDTCTLQLVQIMDGNTQDPVADPAGRSSYYQCADLVLTAPQGGPDAGLADMGPVDSAFVDSGLVVDAGQAAPVQESGCVAVLEGGAASTAVLVLLPLLYRRRSRHAHPPGAQP